MIKTYDFKSPKKFTKERMSIVENLYDNFARTLAPYLTGLLQAYCEIDIRGIVEKRYQEFSSTLADRSLFGMITLSPENKDYNEAPMVMELDTKLAFFMIERLLGGEGTECELNRDFTDIEKAIIQYLLEKLVEFVSHAWNEYMDMKVSLTGLQTNPHLLQMSAAEDVVIEVYLEVVIDSFRAEIHILMPGLNVEEYTSRFSNSFAPSQKKQDEAKRLEKRGFIERNLMSSEVELMAVLHEFPLDAQDILHLQPGDVVPLSKKVNSPVHVYVEEAECFEARIGHTKQRKAIEIQKIL